MDDSLWAMSNDDSKKELAVTGAGLLALAKQVSDPIALIVSGTVALAFEQVGARGQKRAQRVLDHMVRSDDSPQEFAAFVNAHLADSNEEVVTIIRALLIATVDAAELAALEPMALIARRRIRDECPLWVARGALRVLAELTAVELGALREVLEHAPQARHFSGVRFFLGRTDDNLADSLRLETGKQIARGHGRRLAQLLRQHGLTVDLAFTPGERDGATFAGPSEVCLPDPVCEELRAAFLM